MSQDEVRVLGRRRHVQRVTTTITRLQQRGLADPELDARTAAGALVSMLSNFAYWSSTLPEDHHDARSARTLTTIWARAIGLRSS